MQGQYEDQETGLYYNRYRYFDPNICAYVSQDPLGLLAGENVYCYPWNSFGYTDPLGLKCPEKPVQEYEVGTYNDLKNKSAPNDGLDIHHVTQKHPAGQVIDGYDGNKAPSIAVPTKEHRKIPTSKGSYEGNARDLLAKDISDLRQYTNAPNSALQQLIDLNKKMYPNSFIK